MKRFFVKSVVKNETTGIIIEELIGKENTVIYHKTLQCPEKKIMSSDFDNTGDFKEASKGFKNIGSARRFMSEREEKLSKLAALTVKSEVVCVENL